MERQHIVPLNDINYATWKLQMKMLLIKDDLFCIVDGSEAAPVSGSSNYKKFCNRRDKALATIVLAVEPKLLYLLGDPDDPAVVWEKLQNTFQRKTWANKLRLRRKLYSLRLKNGDDLKLHLKTFTELYDELACGG